MKDLQGKVVLVTGAGSGIGLECARAFATLGASIVISDINAMALETVRAEIAATGVQCFARTCDVASEASVTDFATAVHQAVGPVDVLINNAGVAFLGGFEQTPLSEWHRIYDINVLGVVHCIRAFLPAMRGAGGPRKIVNVASAAGFSPLPNMSAYAASKHAVVGLSEVLAQELQRYYADEGCEPSVVAADVVRAVMTDGSFLFTGPGARLGYNAMRVSRRLARRFTIDAARKSGYLAD